jgi:hypothetical protein
MHTLPPDDRVMVVVAVAVAAMVVDVVVWMMLTLEVNS